MNALINAEIDTLPPLPQTITELQRVCLYEDTTIKQVADIIEKDPFLTADLIKYANSPIYGYMHKVDSVFQAVSMFGISSTKGLAIASAVKSTFTINLSQYKLTTKQLFVSGMTIGKDAMGTMSNTLVLAFAGNSLNMMILIYSYGVSFNQLINTDFVAIEVIRAVAGSMGIVLTVPFVAAISAAAYKK